MIFLLAALAAPSVAFGQSFLFRCIGADGVPSYVAERQQGTSCEVLNARYGDRWRHLGGGSNGDSIIIDTETVRRTQKGAQAWVQYLHLKNQPFVSGQWSYITAQREEYNCAAMTAGTISTVDYDEKKNVLNSVNYLTPMYVPITPDSIGEIVWRYLCPAKSPN